MLGRARIEIVLYQAEDGAEPFVQWRSGLSVHAMVRVDTAIRRMSEGNFGDAKSVGGGVMERRLDWGPGYRIYFGKEGDRLVILLGGGTKKRQQKDIAQARTRWLDYKRRG